MNDDESRFARVHDRRRDLTNDAVWRTGGEQLERARALALLGRSDEAGALAQRSQPKRALGASRCRGLALVEWSAADMAAATSTTPVRVSIARRT